MKKSLLIWQIAGFVFTAVMGVILHFLFDWTNQSIFSAPFSAVNESIWEHLKLLYFPMLLFTIIEKRYVGREYKNYRFTKFIGISLGLILIPVLYYTINGAFGRMPDWVNIAIFFVAAAMSYFIEIKILSNKDIGSGEEQVAQFALLMIAIMFAVWTFATPQLPLFKDPITGTYGYWMM